MNNGQELLISNFQSGRETPASVKKVIRRKGKNSCGAVNRIEPNSIGNKTMYKNTQPQFKNLLAHRTQKKEKIEAMKNVISFIIQLFVFVEILSAQINDSLLIRTIFSEALLSHVSYENLKFLCKNTKGRIPGSLQAARAIKYTEQILNSMELDSVYLQELMVPNWIPGANTFASMMSSTLGTKELSVCPLGHSIGTGENGIRAEVVEIKSFDELKSLGKTAIQGKIVFFNRPMDVSLINPSTAYYGAFDLRVYGAIHAAQCGAIGVIVRSLTTSIDDYPHTGVMRYKQGIKKIPAVSISTKYAELLSQWLQTDPQLRCFIRTTCKTFPDVKSFNVIGEIRGNEYPDEIITVGGHLDAWFNTEGAHDDAAGCIHAIEVLRLFKQLHIKPKRTIRAVLFMDEEILQRGGKQYAENVKLNREKHLVAIESDRGSFIPRGFTIDADNKTISKIREFKRYFVPYDINRFEKGFSGTDISPLKNLPIPLIGFLPDNQRYFDYHHSSNDTFEQVNQRELQLGSAAIASLVYLIDKDGL